MERLNTDLDDDTDSKCDLIGWGLVVFVFQDIALAIFFVFDRSFYVDLLGVHELATIVLCPKIAT
jgi:hypothetical protein